MVRFAASLALTIVISGCSSKTEEDAASPTSAESTYTDIEGENVAAADAAMRSECTGFVDGSSRPNSLAGVALGDSLAKVRQQLLCGTVVYDLTEGGVTVNGDEYTLLYNAQAIRHVFGKNGSERVEAKFVGVEGEQKLVEFKRIGEYDGDSPPSVEGVVKEIESKYSKAKRLEFNSPFLPSIRYGYGSTTDGRDLVGDGQISACHSRMGAKEHCGFTFYAMIFPDSKRNPALVKRFEISIFNSSQYEGAKAEAKEAILSSLKQRMESEEKSASKVKGL